MNLSKADVARLGRQRLQPVKAADELLAIWVPGNLVNTKNARLHWRDESRYKRSWRERVATALLECGWRIHKPGEFFDAVPKRVNFEARTYHLIDSDGLQVAIAPLRDALIECGVIHGDADCHGHEFVYLPCIRDRAQRGVEIRVALRAPASEPRSGGEAS